MRLGSHHSEETKAEMSVTRAGCKASLETRAKMSVAHKGNTSALGYHFTEEAKAEMSATRMGHPATGPEHQTAETRAKMSASHMGHIDSAETRAKKSTSQTGPLNKRWEGGPVIYWAKHRAKRRELGWNPLNSRFPRSDGHHMSDGVTVIYIPHWMHSGEGNYHNHSTGKGMAEMDAKAGAFLTEGKA